MSLSRSQHSLKLGPFPFLYWAYANLGALLGYATYVRGGTPLREVVVGYLPILLIVTGAIALRWLYFQPKPPRARTAPLLSRILLKGNAIGLAFMLLFLVTGMPVTTLEVAAVVIFGVGNSASLIEWRYRKGHFRRSGQTG